jgi:hypothetical protein
MLMEKALSSWLSTTFSMLITVCTRDEFLIVTVRVSTFPTSRFSNPMLAVFKMMKGYLLMALSFSTLL